MNDDPYDRYTNARAAGYDMKSSDLHATHSLPIIFRTEREIRGYLNLTNVFYHLSTSGSEPETGRTENPISNH